MAEENGNGKNRVTVPLETLSDEVIIRLNRLDMTMEVGGHFCNLDTGLDMCLRAARYLETQLRIQAAAAAREQMAEQERARQIAAQVRGGR